MNKKIISSIIIFGLITIIPTVYGQLSIGSEAKQESIEVKINLNGEVNVKHIVSSSKMPVSVPLFLGEVSNLIVTNELGEEKDSGIANDGFGNESILIFPSKQTTIIKYNLENASLNDNLFSTNISYNEKFTIYFEEINLIFINNNVIFLDNQKGISVSDGGNAKIEFYSNKSKIIKEVIWEENKFDVEIITNSEIEKFNFDQSSKSIDFEINNKNNKFVTITMSEELLGGPYVTLLNDEKIKHTKFFREGNIVSLNLKPETSGQITIIGTTVIPEFSMFIPLIMGFMIILTVPLMRKFTLH